MRGPLILFVVAALAGCGGSARHAATASTTPDPCAGFTVPKGAMGACDVDTIATASDRVALSWTVAVNHRDFAKACSVSVAPSLAACQKLLAAALKGYSGDVVPAFDHGFSLRRGPKGLTISGVERHGARLLVHFEVQIVR